MNSGQHANEAMMSQIEDACQWSYYQSKSIKAAVNRKIIKQRSPGAPDGEDQSKRTRYEKEQEEIKSEAEQKQAGSEIIFSQARSVHPRRDHVPIAIAIAAIYSQQESLYWLVSLVFGAFGCVFLVLAAMAR